MTVRRIVAGAALALALAVQVQPVRAQTVDVRPVGGIGGGPFRQMCPQGQYVVGIRVRAGAWIDAIGPICAAWNPRSRVFENPRSAAPLAGGGGGGPNVTRCGGDAALGGMQIQLSTNDWGSVSWIQVNCRRVRPPYSNWQDPWAGDITLGKVAKRRGLKVPAELRLCPGRWVATGLFGRAGAAVDRLGFVCAPPP